MKDPPISPTEIRALAVDWWLQVYGINRVSSSAKGRWLARGVETLLSQYPGLRVAFLDGPGGDAQRGAPQYSVLIRGTGHTPQGTDSATQEMYR